MHVFTDNQNREWTVNLTVAGVKRVRAILKDEADRPIDLLRIDESPAPGEPCLGARLATDVVLLFDVLYCLVKSEATTAGIDDEQFGARLGGVEEAAIAAMQGELIDFFCRLGRRELAQLLATQKAVLSRIVDERVAAILGHEEKALSPPPNESTPGTRSTDSPASSASTQTPSP